ncbi:MAG: transposase [Nitrosomonas sp.]|nr:transposase [Nitrosomonas sp.]
MFDSHLMWRAAVVDDNGLVLAVEATAANCHDSKPLLYLLDKANIQPGVRVQADKAYSSRKHRPALKSRGIKNGIQDKAAKNNPRLLAMAYNLKRLPKFFANNRIITQT